MRYICYQDRRIHGHDYGPQSVTGGTETPGDRVCCAHSRKTAGEVRKFYQDYPALNGLLKDQIEEKPELVCCHRHELGPTTDRHVLYAAKPKSWLRRCFDLIRGR